MNIVILDGLALNPGDLSWKGIEELGEVTRYDLCKQDEIVPRLKNAEVAIINKVVMTEEILRQIPHLKAVLITATGYNNVAVDVAKELNISVHNVPAYSTDSVVQLIFSYILHFSRQVGMHHSSVIEGEWQRSETFCYWKSSQVELTGKRLGIIGYGNIGKATAQLGRAFGMEVVVCTRTPQEEEGISFISSDELFETADFISLACALTPQTEKIINKKSLAKMKSSAIVINTGRGPLVDEEALAEALTQEIISGAAVDVLTEEPPRKGSPLIGARNCLVTPHIGWATLEARTRCLNVTADNIRTVDSGGSDNRVN